MTPVLLRQFALPHMENTPSKRSQRPCVAHIPFLVSLELRLPEATAGTGDPKSIALAQGAGGSEYIRGDDFLQQAREFALSEGDAVEGLELFTEVLLHRGAVADVRAVAVFEIAQFFD